MGIALIAHGGAGKWRPGSDDDALAGLTAAVEAGRRVLAAGGSSLDAVCATVVALEDNPIYNAGTGAVLNFDGFCELDACVMESREARAGAVSGLQRARNPILVARKVMEETDHVMLTGDGAQRFARVMGFPDHDPITPERRADWFDKRNRLDEVLGKHALKMRRFLQDHPEYAGGTVGAAAVDSRGVLAAATSTGGVTLKMVGRVGDSPVPGAGNYACARVAASATGTGEFVLRSLATRAIAERVERGECLATAMEAVLEGLGRDYDADVGLIAVDAAGTPVARHRTRDMPHAWFAGDGPVAARMRT
ncbi:MAG TPA: isoaspartyl peptidase/L-asparaginase family protein [Usitatibacteraceae bacterium]|nr:isoaspartyl peptidase/L-asparaginase family protein [Usitatibacteraceae bacterium]